VVHPRDPNFNRADRDFVFLINAYDIDPGAYVPKVNTMLDFNLWTWNSRAFPGIDPIVARRGDRVRIRMGNLTMTNHPMHLHGHEFEVTCTDGGWTRPESRWPEVSLDIGVGQMRAIEFIAEHEGDWSFHCHKAHHTMNAMGHTVKTYVGADLKDLTKKIRQVVPNYMAMGSNGMADMGAMEMPLPDNTLPMMTGSGQFGPIEMGGMFSVVKIREGLAAGDYGDPGWYKHPEGTVAYNVEGTKFAAALDEPVREPQRLSGAPAQIEVQAVKPQGGHTGHKGH